ncbi:DUF5626 family protein [Ectobacillus antri]|uniref:DUF5626 family protein n=1 Tax=Ectobacillus antri TaxID=2486280 RepID=UPI000F59C3C2|nr:DUF5626 family protein [Ectobacillus antri]
MKKIVAFLSFLTLMFLSLGAGLNTSIASAAEDPSTPPLDIQTAEFISALQQQEFQFDLSRLEKQEKSVYSENGEYLGVVGIEPLEPTSTPVINPKDPIQYGQYNLGNGSSTWKIYWYSASVNFSYKLDLYVSSSTGRTTFNRVYEKWKLVTPPYTVQSDSLKILTTTETAGAPADSRYTLNLTSVWGGTWSIYLYARAYNKVLYTGTN